MNAIAKNQEEKETPALTQLGTKSASNSSKNGRKIKNYYAHLWLFLGPAALVLIVMIVYPTIYSLVRSTFDDSRNFVGAANYVNMFTSPATLTALKNNLIWVLVAPFLVSFIGLVLAVLTDKIRWKIAFRLIIFVPMAISMLAAGIIFRSIFVQNPQLGTANAVIVSIQNHFHPASSFPGARPREGFGFETRSDGAIVSTEPLSAGDFVKVPLVGVPQDSLPPEESRTPAYNPQSSTARSGAEDFSGVIWSDFTKGGGGNNGVIDAKEPGLEGLTVELMNQDGETVASAKTNADGSFTFPDFASNSQSTPVKYTLVLPAQNFAAAPAGIDWLGPDLVQTVMILAFVWIWAGFAMVMIGAGLSAVDRSLMEAARTDGANEWQVFRHITVPQLLPTVSVVFVTLIINVLKIFDLVYVIPPGQSKDSSTVVAVEMWRQFGNFNYGAGSTLAILLLVMVLPFMIYQVRNFRKEQ